MGIQFREINIPEDCSKLEWCPLLSTQRQDSESEGDDYKWLEDFEELLDMLNQKSRQAWYDDVSERIYDWTEKWFGTKGVRELEQGKRLRLLDKVFAVSEAGGAPLRGRTLVVFMKLGRSIPYEVLLKEEIDTEIAGKLERPIQGHKRGCKCMGCKTQRKAEWAARKRVDRAWKLRDEFGFTTRFVSIEVGQADEKFRQMLRLAQSRFSQSEVGGHEVSE